MASWQAHLLVPLLKWRLKRKMGGIQDVEGARAAVGANPIITPKDLRIEASSEGGVPVERVSLPGLQTDAPVLLYLHGGGYFGCSPATHRPITASFARGGFRVVAPDYRLAPEYPFPAAVEDAVAAYRALLRAGCDPARLCVAGDSAGGGLALALLVALRDDGDRLPAAAALFSPWTDLAGTGPSLVLNDRKDAMFHARDVARVAGLYLGEADPRTPWASPLYADLQGLPPLHIHVGANEVLLDDSTRLAARARAAGTPVELTVWPVVPHVFPIFPHLPEARSAIDRTLAGLRQAMAEAAQQ